MSLEFYCSLSEEIQRGLAEPNTPFVPSLPIPWTHRVGKIPWRKAWQLTPVFLPKESHGQRSLAGYSLWGHTPITLLHPSQFEGSGPAPHRLSSQATFCLVPYPIGPVSIPYLSLFPAKIPQDKPHLHAHSSVRGSAPSPAPSDQHLAGPSPLGPHPPPGCSHTCSASRSWTSSACWSSRCWLRRRSSSSCIRR